MRLSQPEVFIAVLQVAEMLEAELPMFRFFFRWGNEVVKS